MNDAVHTMNNPENPAQPEIQRPGPLLDLLEAVEAEAQTSQRSLAGRIGVAVGLANALLRRAVRKGFIKVSQVPMRRYGYYLTPEGFAEKSRLVAEYLNFSLSFFRRARGEYAELFEYCARRGWRRVLLAGSGELAEIALISATAAEVSVVGIIDRRTNRERAYGLPVLRQIDAIDGVDAVIVTEAKEPFECYRALVAEVPSQRVLAPRLLRIQTAQGEN
jgi:DNA-binding MarR family transcriptional regulator